MKHRTRRLPDASPNVVLILAEESDPHAAAVKLVIEREHDVRCIVLDTAHYPKTTYISSRIDRGSSTLVLDDGRVIATSDIRSVWRRRVLSHEIDADLSDAAAREVSRRDTRAGLEGFLLGLQRLGCPTINDPIRESAGLNKAYQLTIARELGLPIPPTLISNDEARVLEFVHDVWSRGSAVVFKGFHAPQHVLVSTKRFLPDDTARLGALQYAPAIFQEFIGGANLRVTVIDDHVFAAEVLVSVAGAEVDWRLEVYNDVRPYTLERAAERDLIELVRAFGLRYAAIDLKLSGRGELYFLEANPWGQFLFVEIQTGQPISRAIANSLIAGLLDVHMPAFGKSGSRIRKDLHRH
ncbi:MAG: hypothetical protein M3169_09820 [Candidatus Eremiobacteraeota bacterium]|nr:hypothetical protein [Candidatus Eremiobacteraeota bacterium]